MKITITIDDVNKAKKDIFDLSSGLANATPNLRLGMQINEASNKLTSLINNLKREIKISEYAPDNYDFLDGMTSDHRELIKDRENHILYEGCKFYGKSDPEKLHHNLASYIYNDLGIQPDDANIIATFFVDHIKDIRLVNIDFTDVDGIDVSIMSAFYLTFLNSDNLSHEEAIIATTNLTHEHLTAKYKITCPLPAVKTLVIHYFKRNWEYFR